MTWSKNLRGTLVGNSELLFDNRCKRGWMGAQGFMWERLLQSADLEFRDKSMVMMRRYTCRH